MRGELDRGRAQSYGLTAVGYMGNNTLPARAGDLMRVMLHGGPRRAVLGTVVAERVLDVCALAAIFAFVVADRGVSFGPLPYLAAAGVLVLAALLALRRFAPHVREWVSPIAVASRDLVARTGRRCSCCRSRSGSSEASVYFAVGEASGIHLGASGALYVMALTNLSSMIPPRRDTSARSTRRSCSRCARSRCLRSAFCSSSASSFSCR